MTRLTANPLEINRTTAGYWLTDSTGELLDGPQGPYENEAETMDASRRAWNFYKYENRPGYVTCESARQRRRSA